MKTRDKLEKLRELMRQRNLAAYIIPTDDFHSSEYVGDYFKAREYMSGFTGSAGTLIVLPDRACLWTDGRYFLQAAAQLEGSSIELMRMGQPDVPEIKDFLYENVAEGGVIGFDGRTVTDKFVQGIAEKTETKKICFYAKEDLVGLIWENRPKMSMEPVWELDVAYAGKSREEKLGKVREKMAEAGADVLVLAALDEIAWLLNLRGNDVLYTPVFLSYMLVTKEKATVFLHEEIVAEPIRRTLAEAGVTLADYGAIEEQIREIPAEKTVWIDGARVNYRLSRGLPAAIRRLDKASPVEMLKAVKNPVEMEHMREAHRKDGVAVTRFMRWLKANAGKEKITEISAGEKLEEFRLQMDGYLFPSFSPIISYGAHGAIVHYAATAETDVPMEGRGFCLADTGGHYSEGSTDVTRTIALGGLTEEEKRIFTLVLKGHLRLGAAKFIEGVSGQNLDVLARQPLWDAGLDYNHGTGHGVGYLLNVHEGPQRCHWRLPKGSEPVAFEEGVVLSNEPGLYLTDKFGIRHENLVLCRKGEKNDYGQFMYFEPLTMVPYDLDAIDVSLMTRQEIDLLNDYHKKVFHALSPYFEGDELSWLAEATREVGPKN